jgi:hypothetical protein
MYNYISDYVKNCQQCSSKNMFNHQIHSWPQEEKPWSRVHMDHGQYQGNLILILVDAFSGWPEAIIVPDRSAATCRRVLRKIFGRNGIPNTLVSDNAPEFRDRDLIDWLGRQGCRPMNSPPYHPQSNGIAERMVRTIKNALHAWQVGLGTFEDYLDRILFSYRCTPHGLRSESPSKLMMGRQIRHPFTRQFSIDQPLFYKNAHLPEPMPATFIAQQGQNTAIILTNAGRRVLAHFNQLAPRPTGQHEASTEEDTVLDDAGQTSTDQTEVMGDKFNDQPIDDVLDRTLPMTDQLNCRNTSQPSSPQEFSHFETNTDTSPCVTSLPTPSLRRSDRARKPPSRYRD